VRRLAALVVVALAAACGGLGYDRLPDVDVDELASTTTTARPNYSGIGLPLVGGTTTTSLPKGRARATLAGVLRGPDGAVAGGLVRAEWLVGDRLTVTEARSGEDGRWKLEKLPGGRYRVRAWRAPDLADVDPQVFLLRYDEERTLDFTLDAFGRRSIDIAVAPNPPVADERVNLVVRVADRRVDENGVVRARPLPDLSVEIFGEGAWSLHSTNPATTGADGAVTFTLTCRRTGANPLSAVVQGGDVTELDIPDCVAAPEETTTTTTEPDDETTSTTDED
jgi:hypothetical protein